MDYVWACDPIGSLLFVSSATLILLGLDWAGGAYAWADPHVAAPLAIGLVLLVAFAIYGECSLMRTRHPRSRLADRSRPQNGRVARTG